MILIPNHMLLFPNLEKFYKSIQVFKNYIALTSKKSISVYDYKLKKQYFLYYFNEENIIDVYSDTNFYMYIGTNSRIYRTSSNSLKNISNNNTVDKL